MKTFRYNDWSELTDEEREAAQEHFPKAASVLRWYKVQCSCSECGCGNPVVLFKTKELRVGQRLACMSCDHEGLPLVVLEVDPFCGQQETSPSPREENQAP